MSNIYISYPFHHSFTVRHWNPFRKSMPSTSRREREKDREREREFRVEEEKDWNQLQNISTKLIISPSPEFPGRRSSRKRAGQSCLRPWWWTRYRCGWTSQRQRFPLKKILMPKSNCITGDGLLHFQRESSSTNPFDDSSRRAYLLISIVR